MRRGETMRPKEFDDAITSMRRQGFSYATIAAACGYLFNDHITKNIVIGRARRLGLHSPPKKHRARASNGFAFRLGRDKKVTRG